MPPEMYVLQGMHEKGVCSVMVVVRVRRESCGGGGAQEGQPQSIPDSYVATACCLGNGS